MCCSFQILLACSVYLPNGSGKSLVAGTSKLACSAILTYGCIWLLGGLIQTLLRSCRTTDPCRFCQRRSDYIAAASNFISHTAKNTVKIRTRSQLISTQLNNSPQYCGHYCSQKAPSVVMQHTGVQSALQIPQTCLDFRIVDHYILFLSIFILNSVHSFSHVSSRSFRKRQVLPIRTTGICCSLTNR